MKSVIFKFPEDDIELYCNNTGNWSFENNGEHKSLSDEGNSIVLLPLLEKDYAEVLTLLDSLAEKENVDAINVAKFPFDNVILTALNWYSSYWPNLAIGWLEKGYPLKRKFITPIENIIEDKSYDQKLRHRSRRLISEFMESKHRQP